MFVSFMLAKLPPQLLCFEYCGSLVFEYCGSLVSLAQYQMVIVASIFDHFQGVVDTQSRIFVLLSIISRTKEKYIQPETSSITNI